ncbi:MAG: sodium:proton antiporter [Acidobacteria bacterium]|nr:MAG: sodium:proton antiporter [Acidobacteriota bacterium]
MSIIDIAAILLMLAAASSYINHRYLGLPNTIGLTLSGLLAATVVLLLDLAWPDLGLAQVVRTGLAQVDFPELLMRGMLGFLLFAGALHVDLEDLMAHRWPIIFLSTVGVLISLVVVGSGSYWLFQLAGTPVPFAYCLVFGALISPTDPIAVLSVMKSQKVPRGLQIKVAGESLFNDGIGIVAFTLLLAGASGNATHSGGMGVVTVVTLLLQEVGGGVLLGLVSGYLIFRLMRSVDEANLEILLSVALVMGITFLAFRLHISAPLACVVAGLFIGNHGRRFAMSPATRTSLDGVWSFLDQSLNGVLFLLLGLEVVATLSPRPAHLLAAGLLLVLVLGARLVSVAVPIGILHTRMRFDPGLIKILTWGGLKGGISVALALSLPPFPGRAAVVTATSIIVAFSVVIQGLTIGPLIHRQMERNRTAGEAVDEP